MLIVGMVSLAVGVIGIFVPVLPTTPFLLVSAWSFLRTSKRLYSWLMNHRVLGSYIRNYILHRGTTLRAKIVSLTALWLTLGLSILIVDKAVVKLILTLVGVAVSTHILTLRTIKGEEREDRGAAQVRDCGK